MKQGTTDLCRRVLVTLYRPGCTEAQRSVSGCKIATSNQRKGVTGGKTRCLPEWKANVMIARRKEGKADGTLQTSYTLRTCRH